jgi:hypothetical protein
MFGPNTMANLNKALEGQAVLDAKIAAMRRGDAVLLTVDELDKLEPGYCIRTAFNRDAIGTKSAPYVGWMSGSVSTSPPGLEIDRKTMKAGARAGRCVFSTSRRELPADYYVADDYAVQP